MAEELELPLQEITPTPQEVDPIIVTFDEETLERTLGELNYHPRGSAPIN